MITFASRPGCAKAGSWAVYMDSDLCKWPEAVAYDLAISPDTELATLADGGD